MISKTYRTFQLLLSNQKYENSTERYHRKIDIIRVCHLNSEFWLKSIYILQVLYKRLSIFCMDFDDMMMRWITSILFYSFFLYHSLFVHLIDVVGFSIVSIKDDASLALNVPNQTWCYSLKMKRCRRRNLDSMLPTTSKSPFTRIFLRYFFTPKYCYLITNFCIKRPFSQFWRL